MIIIIVHSLREIGANRLSLASGLGLESVLTKVFGGGAAAFSESCSRGNGGRRESGMRASGARLLLFVLSDALGPMFNLSRAYHMCTYVYIYIYIYICAVFPN